MKIKLNEEFINVGLAKDGDTLCISIMGATDVSAIYQAFVPGQMPLVFIYDDDCIVSGIYANQRVTAVYWNQSGIQVNLQVEPMDNTAEARISEKLDRQIESSNISDDAIAELAELLASLDARVSELENSQGEGEE